MPRKPKIALCAAFSQGFEVASFVFDYPYPVQFVATCGRDASVFEPKIAALARRRGVRCLRRVDANSPEFVARVADEKIDVVLLAWWPTIIKQHAIEAARIGWINMHPSFLPYNRGKHPYYWAIVDGTPFGVTLHFIDEGIDTGRILWQRRVPVDITDTGDRLYTRSVREIIKLFKESYPKIVAGKLRPRRQASARATFHRAAEIERHSLIDWDKRYRAGDLLNILRARSFPAGDSAKFIYRGQPYLVRIDIVPAVKRQETSV